MKEMSIPIDTQVVDKASDGKLNRLFFMLAPFVVTALLLLMPVPEGLQPYAWYYFAIFVGVIVGLIFGPLRSATGRGHWTDRGGRDRTDQSVGAVQS